MRIRLASIALDGSIRVPSHSIVQQTTWVTQIEGYTGWWSELSKATRTVSGAGIELKSAMAYGGRIIFPIANAQSYDLGKTFVGLQGSRPSTPVNLTLHGTFGLGVAHTFFDEAQ